MSANTTKWSLYLSIFGFMLGVGMISSILPAQVMQLTGGQAGVGALASAFGLPYILVQAPLGRWADRVGFKPLLLAGYFLASLTGILYYLAGSYELLLAGRLLHGLSEAPLWALAPALLVLHYPAKRGWVIGSYNAWLHLGLTLGPLLSLALMALMPVEMQFLCFSLFCLLGGDRGGSGHPGGAGCPQALW
jgi:MFS family permease